MNMHDNLTEQRYKWVDVSKAIAMNFVYLGHWLTQYMEAFAYAFHLQLFFIAAGFFAIKTSKRSVKEYTLKQVRTLLIPYFLWVVISFWFNNIDNAEFSNRDFLSIIEKPIEIQPNYWFFSCIYCC